jgi:hypothetical protein
MFFSKHHVLTLRQVMANEMKRFVGWKLRQPKYTTILHRRASRCPAHPPHFPETQYSQSTKQLSKVKPSKRNHRPSKKKLFIVCPGSKLIANHASGVTEVLAEGDEPGAA